MTEENIKEHFDEPGKIVSKREKWSKYRCRDKYIYSPKPIGLRELAKMSDRSPSLLGQWSQIGGWVELRKKYWDKKEADLESIITDEVDRRLSIDLRNLAKEHASGYSKFVKLVEECIDLKRMLANAAKRGNEVKLAKRIIDEVDFKTVELMSRIYDRSVKGVHSCLGVRFSVTPAQAIDALERLGYVVTREDVDKIQQQFMEIE